MNTFLVLFSAPECYDKDEFRKTIEDYIFPAHYEFVLIALHIIVFIVGLIGNTLVCISVYRNHSMRNVVNYFIVNLAGKFRSFPSIHSILATLRVNFHSSVLRGKINKSNKGKQPTVCLRCRQRIAFFFFQILTYFRCFASDYFLKLKVPIKFGKRSDSIRKSPTSVHFQQGVHLNHDRFPSTTR